MSRTLLPVNDDLNRKINEIILKTSDTSGKVKSRVEVVTELVEEAYKKIK